jgi:hypothetical protein
LLYRLLLYISFAEYNEMLPISVSAFFPQTKQTNKNKNNNKKGNKTKKKDNKLGLSCAKLRSSSG